MANASNSSVVAIDSHAHIIDPERFPYDPKTPYLPGAQEIGTLEQYSAVLDSHGISHALIVQPTSGYAHDNRCLLDAIENTGGRLRAIVRIPPQSAREQVGLLDHPRVAGLRLDLVGEGLSLLSAPGLSWLLDALRERSGVLQLQYERNQLVEALDFLRRLRLPIVVDHCGRPDPSAGLLQPGFQALLELGREGHYVKLSGAFRFSRMRAPHVDAEPFVQALIDCFTPRRCVWGSDWPYVRMPYRCDYGPALAALSRWLPDATDRQHVLRDTPAALFGFDEIKEQR